MDKGRNERYTRICARAGEIWLEEGCPGGQHERHWQQAMREIDLEDAAPPPTRSSPPVMRTPGQPRARAVASKPGYKLRSSRI